MSYWEALNARLSRRRALVGSAALATSAAVLAACGGGDDSGRASRGSGLGQLAEIKDTTAKAVPGGVYKGSIGYDWTTMDVLGTSSFTAQVLASWVYSRIIKFKVGVLERPVGDVEGDLAESWEQTPDGLQFTFKLRPNAKWDSRTPTSSRVVDAQDVSYSWERFSRISVNRTDLLNSLNPAAPVQSMTTPDGRTVVFKLAQPYASFLSLLGSNAHLWVMPREADGGFEPKGTTRGSGPWVIRDYQSSAFTTFDKNPNWYRTDRPFIQTYEQPIITETATAISQFEAGNIWTSVVPQEQVVAVKKRHPELGVFQGDFAVANPTIGYGLAPNSPFQDERVRQAFSMLIDRDLFMDTFSALQPFRDEGFPVDVRFASCMGTGWDGWWLDPRGRDFGTNAKYYTYSVAEAKKLLAAAGYAAGGPEVSGYTIPTAEYGRDWSRRGEVIVGMLKEGGVKATLVPVDYSTVFLPRYHQARGVFDGFAFFPHGAHADPAVWAFLFLHSGGGRSHVAKGLDPEADRLIDAQFKEFDLAKRQALIKDLQRQTAKSQAVTPMAGDSAGFSLSWPWMMNVGVYNRWPGSAYGAPVETLVHTWIDQTKLRKS